MRALTKSKILLNLQCPRRLWLQEFGEVPVLTSEAVKSKMRDGEEVGIAARNLHPSGALIDTLDSEKSILDTKQLLGENPSRPLFEAAFLAEGVLVRVDLLFPSENSCKLVEVKSSTSVKEYHKADVAIQTWVLTQYGLPPSISHLQHINSGFKYSGNGDYSGLFCTEDLTAIVARLQDEVPSWIESAKRTLANKSEPKEEPGSRCYDPFECPFLNHCAPSDPDVRYPVKILPYGAKLAEKLIHDGYKCLTQVSEDQLSTDRQKRVCRVSKSGIAEIDPVAAIKLNSLSYPWFFLDFETIAFPVPHWRDTTPYMQVPFQWSCHIQRSLDQSVNDFEHLEYLSLDGFDPRFEFAKKLVEAMEDTGTIIVYNEAFEKARIRELAELFPVLREPLEKINDRIFDLLKVTREHYYHPDMMGSWSIKKVLPTVTNGNTYKDLTVQDGGMAQESYRVAIDPITTACTKEKINRELRDYCGLDTKSMWLIAHRLLSQGNSKNEGRYNNGNESIRSSNKRIDQTQT